MRDAVASPLSIDRRGGGADVGKSGVPPHRAFGLPGWRTVEGLAWTVGILCVAVWTALSVHRIVGARLDVERFTAIRAAGARTEPVDQRLWSAMRIGAWHETLTREAPSPLAVLRIARIGLEVAVLEGTDDWTLNRAVGHIEDTAAPGAAGNSGIAGHRDGFFRGLKDVTVGDEVSIETRQGVVRYRIERVWIVDPEDVSVLDPTPSRTVTLVTCYPFYFVGAAPQRYIVRAVAEERESS
jgi:sortase A